jgi:hypothetical protein
MHEQPNQTGGRRLSFEEALARALERCERGEPPESAAAAFPDHDLRPYLELACRLRALGRTSLPAPR